MGVKKKAQNYPSGPRWSDSDGDGPKTVQSRLLLVIKNISLWKHNI